MSSLANSRCQNNWIASNLSFIVTWWVLLDGDNDNWHSPGPNNRHHDFLIILACRAANCALYKGHSSQCPVVGCLLHLYYTWKGSDCCCWTMLKFDNPHRTISSNSLKTRFGESDLGLSRTTTHHDPDKEFTEDGDALDGAINEVQLEKRLSSDPYLVVFEPDDPDNPKVWHYYP